MSVIFPQVSIQGVSCGTIEAIEHPKVFVKVELSMSLETSELGERKVKSTIALCRSVAVLVGNTPR